MELEQLFSKPVDRAIEGVIKADDEVSLFVELDEYVITNEVAKRLDEFFEAYLNYSVANGVWVSGFFGSGKSHLLKMLALLLQNQSIEGNSPLDLFLAKYPFSEGGKPAADLKRAVEIPSESILFNIDQKADVISKDELDALIAVFIKVFDEHCGYYGKQPYIAQFERDLDENGLLGSFKEEFKLRVGEGRDWEWGRVRSKMQAHQIDAAYTKVTGTSVTNILDKYRDDYRLSIEDFAEQVNAYINSKGSDFRLNFFVDEVGQYVAGNVKLMTNLQTVAESLATKCSGRSWIIVTAQEDMSTVLGENVQQSNDFSRIQARFKNRMKLSSQDVAEVIQKRLLAKRDDHVKALTQLFTQQENNFKTLFDFADGSATYPRFKDCEHFIQSYPFIPYQFALFQSSIQSLSRHSAFEGAHSSVGERSMLGVFQQVAVHIKNHQLGDLATFDLMFEGIRSALKTGIQSSILKAENALDNKFALKVLKALFLVKYVKEFKPTVRNICVLMQRSFDTSITEIKTGVEEALALLENETLIQRNGELFEYLTDEEQDIEEEIKNTDIDTQTVASELEKLIFDGVIKNRKIRWDESAQDYPFTRKLDDNQIGQERELAINIITSFHEHRDATEKHKTDTVYNDELRVVLPDSERLIRDLGLYKKTEKYISHETRTTQQDSVKRILAEKASQNADRYNQLKNLVFSLMGSATYFVGGKEIELLGEDGQTKVQKAFIELVKLTYPNLKMLRGKLYKEADVASILTQNEQGLFDDDGALPEAEFEMLSHIQSSDRGGVRVTVKQLLDRFERKPYGWSYSAVLCSIAYLCARGKTEVRESTNLLDDAELARSLLNSNVQGKLILHPQIEFTAGETKKLKQFFNDYFERVAQSSEAKALAKETQDAFAEQKVTLQRLLDQAEKYPFLRCLTVVLQDLNELESKPYQWFVKELTSDEAKWLDQYKDQVIDPVLKFMNGPNKGHLDQAVQLLSDHKDNLSYVAGSEYQELKEAVVDPNVHLGKAPQLLVTNTQALRSKLEAKLSEEKGSVKADLEGLRNKLELYDGYVSLDDERKGQVSENFASAASRIDDQTSIAVIRETWNNFKNEGYSNLLQQIQGWVTPVAPAGTEEEVIVTIVQASEVQVEFSKLFLETESDVEAYTERYKQALISAINNKKKVRV
ncbi:MAG: BREX system P-loop protein BrxC [Betaproteobacteria bacterium]